MLPSFSIATSRALCRQIRHAARRRRGGYQPACRPGPTRRYSSPCRTMVRHAARTLMDLSPMPNGLPLGYSLWSRTISTWQGCRPPPARPLPISLQPIPWFPPARGRGAGHRQDQSRSIRHWPQRHPLALWRTAFRSSIKPTSPAAPVPARPSPSVRVCEFAPRYRHGGSAASPPLSTIVGIKPTPASCPIAVSCPPVAASIASPFCRHGRRWRRHPQDRRRV